jgi:hypothetical protein
LHAVLLHFARQSSLDMISASFRPSNASERG